MHRQILAPAVLVLLTTLLLYPIASTAKMKVGVYECPPFVIQNDDDTYSGLSILLWQRIAETLELEYEVSRYDLEGILQGAADGTIDVGVSCVSITPSRETTVDFSHSFYETHLAIGVKKQGALTYLKNLIIDRDAIKYVLIFFAVASFIGFVFYLLEHKVNQKFYSSKSSVGKLLEVVMLGIVSIVKGPFSYHLFSTLPGRVLAFMLTIMSTFFVAGITAILASSLTLKSLGTDIKSPEDLKTRKVGVVSASVSSELLSTHGVIHRTYDDIHDLLAALDAGKVEAILTDNAVLKYQLKIEREQGNYEDLMVLPYQFAKQNYGFVLPEDTSYEERLNQALLKWRKSSEWEKELSKYLDGV